MNSLNVWKLFYLLESSKSSFCCSSAEIFRRFFTPKSNSLPCLDIINLFFFIQLHKLNVQIHWWLNFITLGIWLIRQIQNEDEYHVYIFPLSIFVLPRRWQHLKHFKCVLVILFISRSIKFWCMIIIISNFCLLYGNELLIVTT